MQPHDADHAKPRPGLHIFRLVPLWFLKLAIIAVCAGAIAGAAITIR